MTTCNDCQDVLLDMLYDLVDAAQKQQLEAHLASCPACQTALQNARRQQNLFARASHIYRKVPVFTVPEEEHVADGAPAQPPAPSVEEPAILPLTTMLPRKRRRWLPLAAAAAVLLAVAGVSGFYQQRLHHHQEEFAGVKKQLDTIDAQIAQADRSFADKQAGLPKEIGARFMNVQVSGPARLEADVPPSVRVVTRDPAGAPVSAEVTAVLMQGGKELFKTAVPSGGDTTVTLPSGLVRPRTDARLLVIARNGEVAHRVPAETIHVDEATLVTHLVANKSTYQVGETVYFRTLTLKRFSLQPPDLPEDPKNAPKLKVTLIDSEGQEQYRLEPILGTGGISGGQMRLKPNLLTGDYVLRVSGPSELKFAPQERRLTIVSDLPPQLNFDRRHYQAGDVVKARFQAGRPYLAKIIPNQVLRVRAEVDGKKLSVNGGDPAQGAEVKTDARGGADIQVKLPASIADGKAQIEIIIPVKTEKEKAEKFVREIPLAGSKAKVELFPEGGELVAGVPNRVYYRVRSLKGDLVDGKGKIEVLGHDGAVVASATQDGVAGSFILTPAPKEGYRLRISHGAAVAESAEPFREHPIRERGIVMTIPEGVGDESSALRVVLHNTGEEQRLLVLATCRGQIVGQRLVNVSHGKREMTLSLAEGTRGVIRLTVCRAGDNRLTPLAERLVYRVPAQRLKLSIADLKKIYHPGENVAWTIKSQTELGTSTPAWILAAVVDEKVLGPADSKNGSTPAHFYLITELNRPEDLDDAHLLLVDSLEGRKALDLFLGTQGWRRFVRAAEGPDAPAVAMLPTIFSRENESPVKLAALANAKLEQSLATLKQDTLSRRKELLAERKEAEAQATVAAALLAEWRNLPAIYLRTGAGMITVALLLAGAVLLVLGAARMLRHLAPSHAFAGALGALTACLVLYASSGSLPEAKPDLYAELLETLPKADAKPVRENTPPMLIAADSAQSGVFAVAAAPAEAVPHAASQGPPSLAAELQKRFMKEPIATAAPEPLKPLLLPRKAPIPNKEGPRSVVPIKPLLDPRLRSFHTRASTVPSTADTLLWHPVIFTENGSASVSFGIPGNLSSFRIVLYGNSASGRLGSFQATMQVRPRTSP